VKLARLDRALTRLEVGLVLLVLAALTFALLAWVGLKGLSAKTEGELVTGFVFRAAFSAVLSGSLAWRFSKSTPLTTGLIVLSAPAAWLLRDVGVAWAGNVLGWLQDGSLLTWCGGLRGLGTRLTLALAMLGAALATSSGRHVSIDVVSRVFSVAAKAWLARAGGVVAAAVCVLAAWGFFDFTAIDAFHAAPTARRAEKWGATTSGLSRHGSLAWKQFTLDVRMLGRVLGGARWDRALTAGEWNEWLGDAPELSALKEGDSTATRLPVLVLPGESPRGLLVKDLNLVVPLGLSWLALRFLLWVLRGAPTEGAHPGDTSSRPPSPRQR
jgi:TRAP-type C4-dicarboxylate transport system permease small subunit